MKTYTITTAFTVTIKFQVEAEDELEAGALGYKQDKNMILNIQEANITDFDTGLPIPNIQEVSVTDDESIWEVEETQ